MVNAASHAKFLSRARNIYLQIFQSASRPANHFGGPELMAQDRQESAFKIANAAKEISREGRMVSVHPMFGQRAFQRRVTGEQWRARANAKGLPRKAIE